MYSPGPSRTSRSEVRRNSLLFYRLISELDPDHKQVQIVHIDRQGQEHKSEKFLKVVSVLPKFLSQNPALSFQLR